MALLESIEALWREAERLNRPIASFRVPGLTADEVERTFGGPVPADVATWFGWCNGVERCPGQTQDDAALIPGYEPLSASEAAAVRASYGMEDPLLGDNWFPLLATGGGDFYAAVHEPPSMPSRVVSVMIGGESSRAYDSMEHMVNTFRELYRSGVFFVAEDGTLDADDEQWIAIETGSRPDGA
ncbi:hypothetical protein QEP66_06540 [Streptomyces sp. LB8]|uniref:SMI1/KNR4 family protein n=1 Tax=Streptomyces thermogriseus TaxID=75292 RepID=A0ABN1SYJ8_9ACTN|nr:hypothetical protein [Streptomyces sp. LB8]MDN5381767.1 hypothetical protein [Streptomyces sp. LB8]